MSEKANTQDKHFQPQDPKPPSPKTSKLPTLLIAIGMLGILVTISVSILAVWIILLTKNIAVSLDSINLRYYLTYTFITLAGISSFGILFYGARLRKKQHLTGLDRKMSVSMVVSAALIVMYSIPSILLSTFAPIYQLTKQANYTQTQETDVTSDPDSIGADWQTYKNEGYGFEFKHPASYRFEDVDAFESGTSKKLELQECYYPQPMCRGTKKLLSISIETLSNIAAAENKVQEYFNTPTTLANCILEDKFIYKREGKIDNIDTFEKSYKTEDILNTCDDVPQGIGVLLDRKTITYFNKGNEVFTIIQSAADENVQKEEDAIKELNQILSTFRFTDSASDQSNTISWQEAVDLINTCQVDLAFQTHALDVTLTLKDGSQVLTKEPTIDDIFTVVKQAEPTCGTVPLATE